MSLAHYIAFQIIKQNKKFFDPGKPPDYRKRREGELTQTAGFRLPDSVRRKKRTIKGVSLEFFSKEGNSTDKILLYFHGGGFVSGSIQTRLAFISYLAEHMGYNVAAIDYRLAPEHPFPAAPQDCMAAYTTLCSEYGGRNIILIGESAGGNLVLSVVLQAKNAGMELPAAVVAASPTVQYDAVFPSYSTNKDTDCMITNLQEEVCHVYFRSQEKEVIKNPYGAPYHGDLEGFPPTLLVASSTEVLCDDAKKFHEKLLQAHCQSTLLLRKGMMHAYLAIPTFPEAKKDLKKVKAFIQKSFEEKVHLQI